MPTPLWQDPVEGERFLDFLRFCVWVNGESVEENANLVIRLLIRRPECLGPALRGEGEGLMAAIISGNSHAVWLVRASLGPASISTGWPFCVVTTSLLLT